jgi:YVTN family beta-propeller protein
MNAILKRLATQAIAPSVALTLALTLTGCPNVLGTGDTPGIPSNVLSLSALSTLTVGAHPHGIALAGGLLVNGNTGAGTISLIDPATDTVVSTLEFEGGKDHNSPNNTVGTPDGKYAIALDTKANVLRVIKGETRSEVDTVALPAKPGALVWADATTAYVTLLPATTGANTGMHTMHATTEGPHDNVVKVSWPNGFEADVHSASFPVNRDGMTAFTAGALAAGGGFLAVANTPDNSVSFIATSDRHAVTTLKEGNGPAALGISSYGDKTTLVVANSTSNTVTLYDLAAKATIKTFQVGSTPSDMVLRGDGRFAYVTCKGADEVAIIDLANQSLQAQVKIGRNLADRPAKPSHAFAVAKLGATDATVAQQIWVGGDGDDSVTVLDAETQKVVAVITVGKGMHKMAFTAAKAYVSNMLDGTVSVIDRSAIK